MSILFLSYQTVHFFCIILILNIFQNHLATLLKTAEELRIKGLAEVSWKDDEQSNASADGNSNGVQAAIPQVTTVMDSPKNDSHSGPNHAPPNRKKRGRPPIGKTALFPRLLNFRMEFSFFLCESLIDFFSQVYAIFILPRISQVLFSADLRQFLILLY